ncbi:hypothetical protein LPY66_02035 [Dehalobacter sp. DCM]|uniref:hypothetical protein n=1 Tax=Dehalobacter sp. DCM TaxID=2907827 RepID=UPI00308196DF|nr:hypothetical protein LPY66_02035 [Dehalobacter sp. DCM]
MPLFLLHPLYAVTFVLLLFLMVPRKEIQRLSLFGIVLGGGGDSIVHTFGYITGLFSWINYGPFGFIGVHIFANISWTAFFIIYFYYLPRQKPLTYLFVLAGIFASFLYYNVMLDIHIFQSVNRLILPLIGFTVWFTIATWAFLKWNHYIEGKCREKMYPY